MPRRRTRSTRRAAPRRRYASTAPRRRAAVKRPRRASTQKVIVEIRNTDAANAAPGLAPGRMPVKLNKRF